MAEQKEESTKRIDGAPVYAEPTGPIGRNRQFLRKIFDKLTVEFITMGEATGRWVGVAGT